MKRKNATRSALFTSIISLLLCVSMLVGTTFAWFTDEVKSGRNVIAAGNLDVELYANGVKVDGNTVLFDDVNPNLWEPGAVAYENLQVKNVGTLALKYSMELSVLNETIVNGYKLSDVIMVGIVAGGVDSTDRNEVIKSVGNNWIPLAGFTLDKSGKLAAGAADAEFGIVLYWAPNSNEVDNHYNLNNGQAGTLQLDIGVNLFATQVEAESDSFGEDYDAMATVDTIDELNEALAGEYDLIVLGSDLTPTASIKIPAGKTVTIDLNGHTISQVAEQNGAYAMIDNEGTLNIIDSVGNGKVSYEDKTAYTKDPGWASNTIRNVGTLNVKGGTIENVTSEAVMNYGYPHAIDCYQGSVTNITGGTVKSLNYDSIRMFCNSDTLATTVNISGGTIINRISFQDPAANKAGLGRLNISGGNFVTMNGVTANVRLLNFSNVSSNMKATVTGGTFDKGFKTQDIVNKGVKTSDWLSYFGASVVVCTDAELQNALDTAVDGTVIGLAADITGNVTATQKENVKLIIDGNGHSYNGTITVDGKSARYTTAGITIQNVNFVNGVEDQVFVNLGVSGNDNTRYTNNVTVKDCTFSGNLAVAVKSYTGGDWNLTLDNLTVNAGMHSMLQVTNVEQGLKITKCKVYSKNGINLNNTPTLEMSGCEFDVLGYAVRFGVNGNTTNGVFNIANSTLKSACNDGDSVIIFRGTMTGSTLTLTNTTLIGSSDIAGNGIVVSN